MATPHGLAGYMAHNAGFAGYAKLAPGVVSDGRMTLLALVRMNHIIESYQYIFGTSYDGATESIVLRFNGYTDLQCSSYNPTIAASSGSIPAPNFGYFLVYGLVGATGASDTWSAGWMQIGNPGNRGSGSTTGTASGRTKDLYLGCGATSGAPWRGFQDHILAAAVAHRHLSLDELTRIAGNPYGELFKKRPNMLYFDVGGGGVITLTVADALHAHTADTPALTSAHALTVADATHAHSADNVALSTTILLAMADALHGHTADNLDLQAGSTLAVADATHAHATDSLNLTTLSVLAVAEVLHSHLADNVVLSLAGTENLIVADAAHAHSADNLSLASQLALSIAESAHAHTADGVVITSQHVLAVADAIHAHLADSITLSDAPSLTIAEAGHAHTADALALSSDSLLAIADAVHAHLADNVSLTYADTLAIMDAMHGHYADNVVLNFADLLGRAHKIFAAPSERRIFAVASERRIFHS